MQLFVTGASGFIGGAVASAAVKSQHSVRAMARSAKSVKVVTALGATPVNCELDTVEPEHLLGCDVVVHCAAFVKAWGTRQEFYAANVDGTMKLLSAARRARVPRFIHISTEAVLNHDQHMRNVDESTPYPASTPFLYSETKAEAERRVLSENSAELVTIALRPRLVWGPGDQALLPVAVKMVESGMFTWIDHGQNVTSTTHVRNLSHAILLSLSRGRGGEAYFVTDDEVVTMHEFLSSYLKTQGVTPPERSLPSWLVHPAAHAVEGMWRLFDLRSEPPLSRIAINLMSRDCTLRIDKIRREMGYAPQISVAQGLAEMLTPAA